MLSTITVLVQIIPQLLLLILIRLNLSMVVSQESLLGQLLTLTDLIIEFLSNLNVILPFFIVL